ncbi:premnaspirodiene oxygenase-like [Panicum miliaceum]|uniref:Premnaspirodiene oxygenase-like n=1 Tax=Panicum miliaceum TaxID=4540 RepID=A0A3L6SD31_PANMI|nr:premnaspirodiene oxygenase-like [Panicum miliaceum]
MMLRIGPMPLVVVTSRELAREVLKVQDPNFANRPRLLVGGICGYGWADIIFAPTSDYWRRIRKLCIHEVLSPRRILSFQGIREEEVRRQVEAIRAAAAAGAPVNLTRMVYDISSRTLSRSSFGEVRDDMPVFQDAINRVIGLSSGFNVPNLFPRLREVLGEASGMKRKLREIHRTFDRILVDIIEKRRRERAARVTAGKEIVDENVVDVMLTLQQQDDNSWGFPVTDNTIKAVVLDMFAGGTGTSGSSTEWAMSEIVRNPRVMRKLQDDPERVPREGDHHRDGPPQQRPQVPEAGDEGGDPAAPGGAAAGAAGEHRHGGARRVRGARRVADRGERVGDLAGPAILEGPRGVPAGAVRRGRRARLPRPPLRVHAVRGRPADVPRVQLRARRHAAGAAAAHVPLRLEAAPRRGRGRHGGGHGARRAEEEPSHALRDSIRPCSGGVRRLAGLLVLDFGVHAACPE